MKNIKLLSVFVLLVSVFNLVSCSTNEPVDPVLLNQLNANNAANNNSGGNNNGGGTTTEGNFTAIIDGVNFSADAIVATLVNTASFGNALSMTGVKSSGQYIGIQISNPSVGTFVANNNSDPQHTITLSYLENLNSSDIFSAYNTYTATTPTPTGTITISSIDTVNRKISGTFSFDGYLLTSSTPVKHITNGVFNNITYVIQ